MEGYLTGLIIASLAAALIGLLSPRGQRDGIAKHMKLLTSLFLVCVLIAPLESAIEGLQGFLGELEIPGESAGDKDGYREEMDEALGNASTAYFTQMLTQTLEKEFSITQGEVRCRVEWEKNADVLTPTRVTVVLSGRAVWKDPGAIEAFVKELLGCECVSAIE